MSWTKPFYGISHLNGLKKGFRITVREFSYEPGATFSISTPANPISGEEKYFLTLEEAKAYGVEYAKKLNIEGF